MNLELIIPLGFAGFMVITWLYVGIRAAIEEPDETQIHPKYKQCSLCSEYDAEVQETAGVGRRCYYSYKYHMSCVMDVICHPERFDPWKVDQALAIVKTRREHRKKEKEYQLEKIKARLLRKSECRKVCKSLRDGEDI